MAETNKKPNEIQIEISPEVARGHYANLAMILNSPTEFYIDFITAAPGMPKATVQSRIILTPENAKNLLFNLRDSLAKYENVFGEIQRTVPVNKDNNNGSFSA